MMCCELCSLVGRGATQGVLLRVPFSHLREKRVAPGFTLSSVDWNFERVVQRLDFSLGQKPSLRFACKNPKYSAWNLDFA